MFLHGTSDLVDCPLEVIGCTRFATRGWVGWCDLDVGVRRTCRSVVPQGPAFLQFRFATGGRSDVSNRTRSWRDRAELRCGDRRSCRSAVRMQSDGSAFGPLRWHATGDLVRSLRSRSAGGAPRFGDLLPRWDSAQGNGLKSGCRLGVGPGESVLLISHGFHLRNDRSSAARWSFRMPIALGPMPWRARSSCSVHSARSANVVTPAL